MTQPLWGLDLVVATVALAAMLLGIATLYVQPGRLRGLLKFSAGLCFGSVFVLIAGDGMLTRSLSPRQVTTGVVSNVRAHGGKGSYSTFTLYETSGTAYNLMIDGVNDALQPGVRVAAEWLPYSHRVRRLQVLSGPHAGSELRDAQILYDVVSCLVGVLILWSARVQWRRQPDGRPNERTGRTPADGVGQRSLLRLPSGIRKICSRKK